MIDLHHKQESEGDKGAMGCIYVITNLVNGRQYVGRTIDAERRWSNSRTALRGGYHSSKLLQKDWLEFGEDAFEFVVLQEVDDEALEGVEASEIATRKPYYNTQGVNRSLVPDLPPKPQSKPLPVATPSENHIDWSIIRGALDDIYLCLGCLFTLSQLCQQLLDEPSEEIAERTRAYLDKIAQIIPSDEVWRDKPPWLSNDSMAEE